MVFFTENDIDKLLEDDAPLGDMTTDLLALEGKNASLHIYAREDLLICGTEECVRLYLKLGIKVLEVVKSGTAVKKGDTIIMAEGDAAAIHSVWRSGGVMIEFASSIATRTHLMLTKARAINPGISVAGTRKHPPYLKKVALKALMAGGGVPHRTGVSDTILIFKEHLDFTGGYENLTDTIKTIRKKQKERKIVVEAHTLEQAILVAQANADAVQIDKMSTEEFKLCLQKCKSIAPEILVLAAGGVNGTNAAEYAQSGADVLVSSWMYFGPPANIKVQITNS